MNILFDLISTQGFINGGAEYTIKIFNSLIERCKKSDNEIIALYDSRIEIAYDHLSPHYVEKEIKIRCIDISNESLSNIIETYRIDVFFIAIGQRMDKYSLDNINCKVICVIHDLFSKEIEDIKIHQYLKLDSWIDLTKGFLRKWGNAIFNHKQDPVYHNLIKFAQRSNVEIVTVSEYSKFSLLYYYENLKKEIKILYSPEKEIVFNLDAENEFLNDIIQQKKKYFLIISADREMKNAEIVINVFKIFSEYYPDFFLLTIGYPTLKFKNHMVLPYLSASDLEYALKYSYALIFPSLYEGFGYPPLEAMKYEKPVLSSNVCSMPEILGEAPIYFSPFYKADIFMALSKCLQQYEILSNRSKIHYLKIKERQNKALNELLDMITSEPVQ